MDIDPGLDWSKRKSFWYIRIVYCCLEIVTKPKKKNLKKQLKMHVTKFMFKFEMKLSKMFI